MHAAFVLFILGWSVLECAAVVGAHSYVQTVSVITDNWPVTQCAAASGFFFRRHPIVQTERVFRLMCRGMEESRLLFMWLQRMVFSPLPEILSEFEIRKDCYSDPWIGIIRTRVFQFSEASECCAVERDWLCASFSILPFDTLV